VFDFDERIVQAVKRFADKERIEHLDAVLYNCLDPFSRTIKIRLFFIRTLRGERAITVESVNVFAQRGMEAIGYDGSGIIVIADDEEEMDWPKQVLASAQNFAAQAGFFCLENDASNASLSSRRQPQFEVVQSDNKLVAE